MLTCLQSCWRNVRLSSAKYTVRLLSPTLLRTRCRTLCLGTCCLTSVSYAKNLPTLNITTKKHDAIFAQRPHVLGAHIMTYGAKDVVFSNGEYWRQVRKICTTELLSPKRVKSFRSIIEEEVRRLIDSIIDRRVSGQLHSESLVFGLWHHGKTAFGDKCKEQEEFIAFAKEGTKEAAGFGLADVFPSVKLLHVVSGTTRRMEKLHRQSDTILSNIISEHMANRKASPEVMDGADNLLGVLMNLKEHGDLEFPLTNDNIKAVIQDMFVAGGETSSSTVDWAMAEMLKNPRIMEKAQTEARKVFSPKGVVDEAGLQESTFLKCIIKETLRFHPPTPLLLPRECREQCKINGYYIPLKTKVIVNASAINRDPRHWTEPDRFYPERFLDSPVEFRGTDFEFVPFGAGRRISPGISFALPNLELPLASFLYHFDWKLANGVKSVRRQNDLWLIAVPNHTQ